MNSVLVSTLWIFLLLVAVSEYRGFAFLWEVNQIIRESFLEKTTSQPTNQQAEMALEFPYIKDLNAATFGQPGNSS